MWRLDDKSEGRHLYRTKYFNFGHIIWRKILKFLYDICTVISPLFIFANFFLKNAKNVAN